MRFILTGFLELDAHNRRYAFEGIGDDRNTKKEFTVDVNLTLLHKYGIPIQEAPLLCGSLLASSTAEPASELIFTEEHMRRRDEERTHESDEAKRNRSQPVSAAEAKTTEAPAPLENGGHRIGLGSTSEAWKTALTNSEFSVGRFEGAQRPVENGKKRAKMESRSDDIVLLLTLEEFKALEKGLRELTRNTGAPELAAQKKILAKIEAIDRAR